MTVLDKYFYKFKLIKAQLILGFFIFIGFNACTQKPKEMVVEGLTMGTSYTIKIITQDFQINAEHITYLIDSVLLEINNQMSTYIENSEINRFHHYSGKDPFLLSPDLYRVVERALYWTEMTEGAFDITILPLVSIWGFGPDTGQSIPSDADVKTALNQSGYDQLTLHLTAVQKINPNVQLDLNAIAKGYGVDALSLLLDNNGFTSYMVEIGGEVFCKGVNKKGKVWRIGIESPNRAEPGLIETVSLQNNAIASSGDYRNYYSTSSGKISHIMDPRTGQPASTIAAATVMAGNCMDADALATALMVMGAEDGINLIEKLVGVEAMIVKRSEDMELEKMYSSGFKKATFLP